LHGKIWVQNGEITDAVTAHFTGEDAFKEILSWKSGNFEILPADPGHVRTITNSYQGLLLDSAQALDEWRGQQTGAEKSDGAGKTAASSSLLAPLTRFEGVEFLLTVPVDEQAPCDSWALENARQLAVWARATCRRLVELGENLEVGPLAQVSGFGLQQHWALAHDDQKGLLCVGFRRTMPADKVDQTMKHVFTKWVS
jgi:hypothetical protein